MSKKYSALLAAIVLIGAGWYIAKKVYAPASRANAVMLQVPFSAQAPTGKWDRNEDCEETSITMANSYLTGNTSNELPAQASLEAIQNLKKWEEANLGYNADTGAAATKRMAEGAFGLKVQIVKDFTEADIKKALSQKHPVLLPIDARVLKNAQYQNSGPTYHMVVIRGYDGSTFTINDPGTSHGNGNQYSYDQLHEAAANWNHSTSKLETSNKTILVLSK